MMPAPCEAIWEPGRTAAPPPKDTHRSHPAAHCGVPARLSKMWAEGGCWTLRDPQSPWVGLVPGRSAAPWGASFPPGTGKEKAWPCQPKVTAVQSGLACFYALASQHVLGVQSSAIALFQLYFACCDNRRLNFEQHYETSEIDVSISWYSIPGMTCLLCPLTVLVEAYQNAGHVFSNSIAGIQLEKCVSLSYGHMLYIPLQHIISCSICTEFDTA